MDFIMKKVYFLLSCLFALHSWNAAGENRLYIENFSIDPGATVDVAIMLNNDVTDFASFQADMYLPEGLELVQQYNADDEEFFTFLLTTRARSRMSIGSAVQSDGSIRLMLTQTLPQAGQSMQTIKESSGALVTFQLKAADNASGTKYIRLENIVFTTATETQYNLENSQTTVTITGTSDPDTPTGNMLFIEDFSIDPGATVDIAIMLNNDVTDFASFQADMYLPEGLELVQQYNEDDEEYFTFLLTTRARSRMSIGSAVQSDGATRLMLTQTLPQAGQSMQTIKESSGALVTFKLKAADNASGTKYIRLENIVFTTATETQYNLENSQTTVTIGSSSLTQNMVITTNVLNLFTGTSQTLVASPSNATVSWTSSNPAIATVSSDGTVTAVAPGTTTVTCTANGVTSSPFTVNVFLLGDVNGDKTISIADAVSIVNIILSSTQQ